MIQYKIYNDDKIRTFYNFPTMKDPNVLELTLLRIINEFFEKTNQPLELEFNINNPRLGSLYFTYYTSSNFYSWGELPLLYIYHDMVRHIQNQNTSNNFIMTLESIYINIDDLPPNNIIFVNDPEYKVITKYVSDNYLNSYNHVMTANNGVLVAIIPVDKTGLIAYIISVGFEPYSMSKWFSTKISYDIPDYPFARSKSFLGAVKYFTRPYPYSTGNVDELISVEFAEGRSRDEIVNCNKILDELDIKNLKKKSIYDTEVKYGNFPLDYNILSTYDICKPALSYLYRFGNGKMAVNKFNQYDRELDYNLLKNQNRMIKVEETKKGNIRKIPT